MAGTVICDFIQAAGSSLSMNVGNTLVLTANSSGLTYIPTGNVNVNIGSTASLTLGTLVVSNTATFSNTTTHTGAATFANTLGVTGATTLSSTLGVTGASLTLGGDTVAAPILTINGTAASSKQLKFNSAGTEKWNLYMAATTHVLTLASTALGPNVLEISQTTGAVTIPGTLGVTGTITPGQTTGIVGTTTNNNVQAGSVGQYVESVVASVAYPATGDWGDATSISLTAGDWDVSISSIADSNSSTWSFAAVGISVTTGNFDTGLVFGSNWVRGAYPSSSTTPLNYPLTIPTYRQSLAGTTTIYMKIKATYSAGSPLIHGRISARRVR